MLGSLRNALIPGLLLPFLSGCWLVGESRDKDESAGKTGPRDADVSAAIPASEAPKLCAAIRGNGNYVITHFTSLARLSEHYGVLDALAGGSSATISVFLYESMRMNPELAKCADRACTPAEVGDRMALLLKSVKQYFTALITDTDEALAIRGLQPIAERVQAEGVKALLDVSPLEAATKLYTILSSADLKDLINPEILAQLVDVANAGTAAPEVYEAITSFGAFSATDPKIFFRPGVLSFEGLAAKIGRMGSFYAGYGPFDAARFADFFAACGQTRGKSWEEIAALPAGADGGTCARMFDHMVLDYRRAFVAAEATTRSRVDDPVGAYLHSVVATSVISGPAGFGAFSQAMQRYKSGEAPAFAPAFEDVRFGYFGAMGDLTKITADGIGFGDLKTKKALALGPLPWRVALSLSPAEPGLARIKEFSPDQASAGGWPDLHPVQALKNIGCAKVVYVTRRGEDSKFARGVAKLLGMPDDADKQLYDLDDPQSSFSRALGAADAVWCTDWDRFKDEEITEMANESYAAVLETKDPYFTAGATAYANRSERTNFRGCSAGAPAVAAAP